MQYAKLTGSEDSPVYGIKFAAIRPEYSFLLYPARWFPLSGYSTDRFAAEMRITVPMGQLAQVQAGQMHVAPIPMDEWLARKGVTSPDATASEMTPTSPSRPDALFHEAR